MGRCHTTLGLPSFARRLTGDERGGEDGNPLPSRCVQAYELRPELKNSGGVGVIVSLLSFFSCPPFSFGLYVTQLGKRPPHSERRRREEA